MYSNNPQAETMGISRHDDRPAYLTSNSHPHHYSTSRTSPTESRDSRQLELRQQVPISWPESQPPRTTLPHDPLRAAMSSTPLNDPRPQGQSLPALRDILSSPTDTTHPPTLPSWNSPSTARPSYDFGRPAAAHPPLTLQPSAEAYSAQPLPRFEARNTEPDARRQSVTLSPYPPIHHPQAQPQPTHTANPHERHSGIHSQPQNGPPQAPTRTPSSYPPSASEDIQMSSAPSAGFDPTSSTAANSQAGGEGLGKCIGTEKTSEGTFYLYEDGRRIPVVIDGETVNPKWGLTKANKPRKRLALACLDCREKKIKCEPGETSCLQCEKAKRPCRKAPQNAPIETTPAPERLESLVPNGPPSVPAAAPPQTSKRPHEVGFLHPIFKRPRPGSPIPAFGPNTVDLHDLYRYQQARDMPKELEGCPRLSMETDPYAAYPEWTMQLLDLFFNNLNHFSPFPAKRFMRWVTMDEPKNEKERGVLYATLAFASRFVKHYNSFDPRMEAFGDHCYKIATDIVFQRMARPNLCLCITRMMLGLYTFSQGDPGVCWDHVGAGIASALSIGIYTEHGCHVDMEADGGPRFVFDFTRNQLIECKRRMFWCLFVIERLGAIPKCSLKPEDTFLRLPTSEDVYEHGLPSEAPFYNNDIMDKAATRLTPGSQISIAAWLINIAAIQGDVLEFSQRLRYRGSSTYLDAYEEFYTQTNQRIRWWLASLPEHLRYDQTNLERRFLAGCGGIYLSMHTFHHHVVMLLNRTVQHSYLTEPLITRNIGACLKAGRSMIQVICDLRAVKRADEAKHGCVVKEDGTMTKTPTMWGTNVSFTGYTALLAIDVTSAGGFDWELRKIFSDAKRVTNYLMDLLEFWASALGQKEKGLKRCYQIANIMAQPHRSASGAWLGQRWGLQQSCLDDEAEATTTDTVYGVPDFEVFFSAFKEPTEEERIAAANAIYEEDREDRLRFLGT